MRQRALWTSIAAAVLFGLAARPGLAIVEVVVQAVDKAKVAVPDFTQERLIANTPLGRELSAALRFDLDNCGYYDVIGNAQAVANAQARDVETGKVLLPSWRGLDAALVFKADYELSGGTLALTCLVYETDTGKLVFNRRVRGAEASKRRLVHALSDEIVKVLAGAAGIATTQIAFIKENDDGGKDLYLIDYDGHNLRRVTSDKGVAVSPDWSPDGQQIYYTSMHKGEPDVYRVDWRKRERATVAAFPGLNYAVAVSPDGTKLALVLSRSGTPDIYTTDINGKDPVRLTRSVGQLSTCPVWSYDGTRIAYVSNIQGGPQIYTMNADGTNQRQLVKGYRDLTSLDWSPARATGDLIAFSAKTSGRRQIFVVDVRKGVVQQLTTDAADHEDPNFAPDGRHIVYVTEPRSGAMDLYLLDVFDPKPVRITSFAGNESYPAWSPTGY